MMIPMRGGRNALSLSWGLGDLMGRHSDLNKTYEESWAGMLHVIVDSWADWPVEVWLRLVELELTEEERAEEEDKPLGGWALQWLVSFAGEGPERRDVAAMVSFVTQGLESVLGEKPAVGWTSIDPGDKAMWVIDDGSVYRLYADVPTEEPMVFLIGHYAGEPALFAAAVEAWPLHRARRRLNVDLAEADLGWAFVG